MTVSSREPHSALSRDVHPYHVGREGLLVMDSVMPVCRRWFSAYPARITRAVTPGFSGSRVFIVEPSDAPGRFVLKAFHAAATHERAAFVHRLMRHLRAEGIAHVPEVIPTLDGETIVIDAEGLLWELCRFMPGVAVPRPTPGQAAAAATALARLHLAAARLPSHPPRRAAPPGLLRRITRASGLLASPWQAHRHAWLQDARRRMPVELCEALEDRMSRAIEIFATSGGEAFLARLSVMEPPHCTLHAVLRDVWHEHVLFIAPARDEVAAIIDLHAAGIDTPATDLARLVGSWDAGAGDEYRSLAERWPDAFAAYREVRPLPHVEAMLIPRLHATGVVLGLDNWFRWTFEQHRDFPDATRLLERIDRLLTALPAAVATA